jgi:YidC/Oxa1 family membrane protein insertase
MDRKSLIILVASFVLLMLWYPLTNKLFPPVPVPPGSDLISTNQDVVPSVPGTTNLAEITSPPPVPFPAVPEPRTPSTAPEQLSKLENPDVRYTFTSRGGGLKFIELKGYPATVNCRKPGSQVDPRLASLNTPAPAPILSIIGGESVEGDGHFALTHMGSSMRAEKLLSNGLRLVKDFTPSTNYLLKAVVRLENRSTQPLALPAQEWVIGAATPIGLHDESIMLGLEWYNGSSAHRIDESWFANRTLGCLPGTPRSEFRSGTNVVWGAVQNQFFTVVTVPAQPAPAMVGRKVALPAPTREQVANDSRVMLQPYGYEAALFYPQVVLAPNQVLERQFDVYAGPKEYNTLARLPNNVDLVMGFGGFFGFFAKGAVALDERATCDGTALRGRDHRHHHHHQTALLASDPGQHSFHETNAGVAAANEGSPGEVQG